MLRKTHPARLFFIRVRCPLAPGATAFTAAWIDVKVATPRGPGVPAGATRNTWAFFPAPADRACAAVAEPAVTASAAMVTISPLPNRLAVTLSLVRRIVWTSRAGWSQDPLIDGHMTRADDHPGLRVKGGRPHGGNRRALTRHGSGSADHI